MTATPRFHWRTSFALLVLVRVLGMIFMGPQDSLTVIPRPPGDLNLLRVACTHEIIPNPQIRNYPLAQHNQLILSLWEPLVECDPVTGQPLPAAARNWVWSADRLALTIHLRTDGRWSNGDPVMAPDFVRSWLQLLRLKKEGSEIFAPLHNASAYQMGKITDENQVGISAVDDYTLRLELDKPRATLVMELADPLLSPLHRTSEEILKNKTYFERPASLVTNGPFHLVQANPAGFTVRTNSFYHDVAGVRLAGVRFIMADNLHAAQLMLAAGVVDLLAPMPLGETRRMPTHRPFVLESELEPTVNSIDFNVGRPPLGDVRVRRALALALDRVGPIDKYDPGHLIPAWSWVPEMPGRTGLKLLKEDAAEARQLLASAGYPDGKGFPILRLVLPLERRPNRFALAWAERWFRELGVRTYVTYEFSKKNEEHIQSHDYEVRYNRLTATVPDAGDLLAAFSWPSDFNGTTWHDEETIALLTKANSETGDEHLASLEQAERRVMDQLPSIPMMFERRQTLLAGEVLGWYRDPLLRQNLKRLHLESGL